MTKKKAIINFRNRIQKVLWEHEYCGQFSDGHWENSPMKYQVWTRPDVFVNADNVGTTVPKYERRYTLDTNDLLNVVGYRMLGYARFEFMFPGMIDYEVTLMIDHMIQTSFEDENRDYRNVQVLTPEQLLWRINNRYSADAAKWNLERIERLNARGISLQNIYDALTSKSYTIKDYRRDIVDMDNIIRTQIEA